MFNIKENIFRFYFENGNNGPALWRQLGRITGDKADENMKTLVYEVGTRGPGGDYQYVMSKSSLKTIALSH